jgi:hypothetical protein
MHGSIYRLFCRAAFVLATAMAFYGQACAAQATHHTAEDMYHLYMATPTNCGDNHRPAFLCSGIIIRSAKSGATWNVWDMSPLDLQVNGVSFSYIRQDVKTKDIADGGNTSGFTLLPAQGPYSSPTPKHVMQVLCAFPQDGWTNERNLFGCGTSQYGATSGECQEQGIMTAAQWVAHYNAVPKGDNSALWQCGFDVHSGSSYDTADAFMQMIQARLLLGVSTIFDTLNELRIATWKGVSPADLPIQSFFYVVGEEGGTGQGVVDAKVSQKNYFAATGIFVPVVQISVPATPSENMDFHILPGDQAVPFPN